MSGPINQAYVRERDTNPSCLDHEFSARTIVYLPNTTRFTRHDKKLTFSQPNMTSSKLSAPSSESSSTHSYLPPSVIWTSLICSVLRPVAGSNSTLWRGKREFILYPVYSLNKIDDPGAQQFQRNGACESVRQLKVTGDETRTDSLRLLLLVAQLTATYR